MAKKPQPQPQQEAQQEAQQEPKQIPNWHTIPEYRWIDEHGRIYQLDNQGGGNFVLRIVG